MAVDLKKDYAGQPGWVWLAGGLAVAGGLIYLLYKSRKAGMAGGSAAPAGTAAPAGATGLTTGQLQGWIADHQGSTVTTHKTTCPKGYYWSKKHHRCQKITKK